MNHPFLTSTGALLNRATSGTIPDEATSQVMFEMVGRPALLTPDKEIPGLNEIQLPLTPSIEEAGITIFLLKLAVNDFASSFGARLGLAGCPVSSKSGLPLPSVHILK